MVQGVPYLEKRAGIEGRCNEQIHSGRCAKWRADAVVKGTQRRGAVTAQCAWRFRVWRAEQDLGMRGFFARL